jgi:hypothetical protein
MNKVDLLRITLSNMYPKHVVDALIARRLLLYEVGAQTRG